MIPHAVVDFFVEESPELPWRVGLVTCRPLWSSEALSNMSNLRGISLEIRPIWGINYLTRHLPLAKEDKVTFTIIFQ